MIPAIALMIAIYGTGRLLNDGFKRHPNNVAATALTWVVSILVILALWFVAVAINQQGASTPSPPSF